MLSSVQLQRASSLARVMLTANVGAGQIACLCWTHKIEELIRCPLVLMLPRPPCSKPLLLQKIQYMSTGRPPQGRGLDAGSSGGNVGADRSGSLWTCRGCHRNNEARLDACYHCRSRAPPRKTNQGSTFATNPYERFIRGGSNSIAGNPGGVSRRSGLALPTSARGQGQTASRTANMVRGASTNAGQGCHLRSGNAVGGTSRCKSSTFSAPARRPRRLVPIDPEAAGTWIYPVNYPVRKYQQQIVTAALFSNTLVALPTGLGKTLIAAVVMYNFYRW